MSCFASLNVTFLEQPELYFLLCYGVEINKEANTWFRVCLLVDLFGFNLGERDHAFAVGAIHQNAEGLGQTDVAHMFGLLYRRQGIELSLMQAAVALEVVDSHVADA